MPEIFKDGKEGLNLRAITAAILIPAGLLIALAAIIAPFSIPVSAGVKIREWLDG